MPAAAAAAASSSAAAAAGSVERRVVELVLLGLGYHDLSGAEGRSGGGRGGRQEGRAATSMANPPGAVGAAPRSPSCRFRRDALKLLSGRMTPPLYLQLLAAYFGEGLLSRRAWGWWCWWCAGAGGGSECGERGPRAQAAEAARGAGGGLQAVALVVLGGGRWRLRVLLPGALAWLDGVSSLTLSWLPRRDEQQQQHDEPDSGGGEARSPGRRRRRARRYGQRGRVIPRPAPGRRRRRSCCTGGMGCCRRCPAAGARVRVVVRVREEREGRARLVLALLLLLAMQVRGARQRRWLLREEAALELQWGFHVRAVKAAGRPGGGAPCAMRYGRERETPAAGARKGPCRLR